MIAVNWVYGLKRFMRDIEFMLGRQTGYYWRICWAFLIPVLLAVIFSYTMYNNKPLTHGKYVFGSGANGMS